MRGKAKCWSARRWPTHRRRRGSRSEISDRWSSRAYPGRCTSCGRTSPDDRSAEGSEMRKLIAAAAVLVAAIAVMVFVFGSRDDRIAAPPIIQSGPERTPAFAFAVARSGALPTAAIRSRKPVRNDPLLRLHGASRLASRRAIASITRLYRDAFLVPAHWQSGTYESLWRDFTRAARARARTDVRVLTAGATAGEAYDAIVPRPSAISTTVLLERKGKPVMVLVNARFRALGRRIAGSSNTRFDSTGRFFFQRVGGSWKIVSYDVRRSDDRVEKSLPSSSAAPDASATGTP